MAYTATNWVEGVTTLGPTNMNKIETELVYLDTRIPAAALGYGTTLPGSPVDGQEAILVDSTTSPSYQWRFRYNSSNSTAYKWEFVGGAAALNEVTASEVRLGGGTTYADITTAGPQLTAPRAGVYDVAIGAAMYNDAGGGPAYMSYQIGATAAVDADALYALQPNGVTVAGQWNLSRVRRKTLASGDALVAKYKVATTGNGAYANRWMTLIPVRVS